MSMLAAMLALTVVAASSANAATPPCKDCNVLWIVIDTTREDYVGPDKRGFSNTPNLDRIAERGLDFEHAYAQGGDTMVSVSSYMTGRYRINTGMNFSTFNREQAFHQMADEVTTIAEVLGASGYETMGYTCNALIAAHKWNLNLQQGFDTWQRTNDDKVAPLAIQALDANKDKPFFLYVHLMGPHFPNTRLPDFEKRRGKGFPDTLPDATGRIYTDIKKGRYVPTEQGNEYLRALYADGLWQADAEVGKILDHFDKSGLGKKTLVVFTSDHGESLGEMVGNETIWGHGGALRNPLLHVPLYVSGPGIPHKTVGEEQVAELVDLAPTIIHYLGLAQDEERMWVGDPLFGTDGVKGTEAIADRGIAPNYALSVRTPAFTVEYWPDAGKWWYTDLLKNPNENTRTPLKTEQESLKTPLLAYWENLHIPGEQAEMAAPEGDELKNLKALGYME